MTYRARINGDRKPLSMATDVVITRQRTGDTDLIYTCWLLASSVGRVSQPSSLIQHVSQVYCSAYSAAVLYSGQRVVCLCVINIYLIVSQLHTC